MPTTYTNGLKLPDLGSIDWYSSYKNNIDILDPIVGTVNGVATTYAPISHNHSASEITSGTIDIARLPPAALERMHIVADQTARYALTTSTVQEGDTVKQTDTGIMYLVVDSTKLNSADGYTEYSAGTASKAIADEDGTSIKTGYVNVAGNQTVSGQKIWSGNQFFTDGMYRKNTSYEIGNTPASNVAIPIYFVDKANVNTGYIRNTILTTGKTQSELLARNKFTNGALNPTGTDVASTLQVEVQSNGDKTLYFDGSIRNNVLPYTTNTYSLGSSSYQWSSVYAQTYYYNGTAWGLDKSNTWTGSNTYTNVLLTLKHTTLEVGVLPASNQTRRYRFTDKNNTDLGWLQHRVNTSGDSYLECLVTNKFSNGQLSTQGNDIINSLILGLSSDGSRWLKVLGDVYPDSPTRVCNLGTSSNQWSSIYAQNYYYNGTQWGLDKANTWTTTNIFTGTAQPIFLRGSSNDIYNVSPQNTMQSLISFVDKDNTTMSYIAFQHRADATETHRLCLRQQKITSDSYYGVNLNSLGDFYPEQNNAINLGTSDKKWKTFNGINPGALSLPDSNYVDIDTTNWDKTGATSQSYTPAVSGWLFVSIQNIAGNYLSIVGGRGAVSMDGTGAQAGLRAMLPVAANESVGITVKTGSIFAARFYPMLGNV